MTIVVTQESPPDGRSVVGEGLRDLRVARAGGAERSLLGGAKLNLSKPLPLYRLDLSDVGDASTLSKAKHVGWRYLIEEGADRLAFVDLAGGAAASAGEPARFASLTENAYAQRLHMAAEAAQSVAEPLPEEYEARFLEAPALHAGAVWLTGPTDLFIPYNDFKRRHGDPPAVEPNFLDNLLAASWQLREQLIEAAPAPSALPEKQ